MSEYQYYEFQAVDRRLTEAEMHALRAYSSRAQITPTRFVNEYHWGDFKGDSDVWMEKYFDAFLYFANWGTRILKLRLPAARLDLKVARTYCYGDTVWTTEKKGNVILTFCSELEGGEDTDVCEGSGLLSSLISVREQLARGDHRALYLGWLVALQNGELDDDEVEPPLPAGLGNLSGSLEALADFLRIDSDLLHVAALSSATLVEQPIQRDAAMQWITALPNADKDELLTRLIVEPDNVALLAELQRRFLTARDTRRPDVRSSPDRRRTVGELLNASEKSRTDRQHAAELQDAAERVRRERQAAAARQQYLNRLAGKEEQLWAEVDGLVLTKLPKNYDKAMRILGDLRDLAARSGDLGKSAFMGRLDTFRAKHARKPSLLARIVRATF